VDVIFDNLDRYAEGTWTTIQLTLISFACAFVIGVVVASFRVSPVPPLRWAGGLYVETVRNTPLLVLLILAFFGLPKLGFTWSPFATAIIVISAYTGAFVAEVVRAGINTVAAGQAEAARALGLTFPQVLGHVVLPQALRSVVQPLGSLFSALVRNTSLAYAISVVELTGTADQIGNETAEYLPAFIGAFIAYLILTIPTGFTIGVIERRVAVKR
jgi:glutamate transport system permease protein